MGSTPAYSERLPAITGAATLARPLREADAIERTVRAASTSEASEMSSE